MRGRSARPPVPASTPAAAQARPPPQRAPRPHRCECAPRARSTARRSHPAAASVGRGRLAPLGLRRLFLHRTCPPAPAASGRRTTARSTARVPGARCRGSRPPRGASSSVAAGAASATVAAADPRRRPAQSRRRGQQRDRPYSSSSRDRGAGGGMRVWGRGPRAMRDGRRSAPVPP